MIGKQALALGSHLIWDSLVYVPGYSCRVFHKLVPRCADHKLYCDFCKKLWTNFKLTLRWKPLYKLQTFPTLVSSHSSRALSGKNSMPVYESGSPPRTLKAGTNSYNKLTALRFFFFPEILILFFYSHPPPFTARYRTDNIILV